MNDSCDSSPPLNSGGSFLCQTAEPLDIFEAVSSRVSAQREAAIYTVLERGKERGELRPDADITVVPHLLVGGIHAMRVFPGAYGDPEGDFVTQMVDVLLAGIAGENT